MYMSIVLKNSNYYDILSIFHWRIETLYLWLRYSSFNTVPKQCLHLCKVLRLTHFSSKRSNNILIQLNMSTATWHIYLLISTREYDSYVKCSSCHDIDSIAINSNVDSYININGNSLSLWVNRKLRFIQLILLWNR